MNDKYLQYHVEDFLTDDAFVNWVLDGTNKLAWEEWLKDHPESKTQVKEASFLIGQLKFKEEQPSESQSALLWNRINASISKEAKIVRVDRRRNVIRLIASVAVAASLALLIFTRMSSGHISLSNDIEDSFMAVLPAESTVELLGHTSIEYNEKNWSSERSVKLNGEARFNVTKGVSFVVETDNGQVRVLGTKFKVYSRDDDFYVLVESGRVEVSSGNEQRILTANMNFVRGAGISETQQLASEISEEAITFYQFEREDFSNVFQTIERIYDVQFEYDMDIESTYTGSFTSDEGFEEVMQQVLYTINLNYNIEGKTVQLTTD